MSKKKIYYRANDVVRSHNIGYDLMNRRSVEIVDSYVKRYKNCIFLLAKLSKTERLFLDYLTEIMDENNYVANNKATREGFNRFMRKLNLEEYKESTIHKCFSRLCKENLITAYKGKRGMYQVSPYYFYSDNPNSGREKLIREMLEEPHKEPIKKKRHNLLKNKGLS